MFVEFQFGPQQLKYKTVRKDSSACLIFSLLAALRAAESKAPEKSFACLDEEEQEESLRDLTVESHFEAWSFIPCNTLLMYFKLMPPMIYKSEK
jgi:hypothetical protein